LSIVVRPRPCVAVQHEVKVGRREDGRWRQELTMRVWQNGRHLQCSRNRMCNNPKTKSQSNLRRASSPRPPPKKPSLGWGMWTKYNTFIPRPTPFITTNGIQIESAVLPQYTQTYQPTNRPTNGQTDRQTDRYMGLATTL